MLVRYAPLKMKTLLLFIFIFFALIVKGQEPKFPTIIYPQNGKCNIRNAHCLESWKMQLLYMGKIIDSISLSTATDSIISNNLMPLTLAKKVYYNEWYEDQPHLGNHLIDIFYDTTQLFQLSQIRHSKSKFVEKTYAGFPVLIRNNSDSFACIGFGEDLSLIIEALDTDSTWKPITKEITYRCATGQRNIYLKPNDWASTLAPKFTGKFSTFARFRLNANYSKIFRVTINEDQFTKCPEY